MLLVVGAMAILSTLTMSINTTILQAYVVSYDSEATIDAMSFGQAMIDEIQTQAFDSVTTTTQVVKTPALCTPPSRLGADIDSEKAVTAFGRVDSFPYLSQVDFNDVDDYNHYSRLVKSTHLGNFIVRDSVFYVQEASLDVPASTQTWYKKILVTISHPNLFRPVVMKSIVVFRRYIPPS